VTAPAEKREDLFRLWIDQGVRFQVVQPVRIPKPFYEGEEILREEVRVTGRLGIRASLDAAGFAASKGMIDVPADTATRTFRVYSSGDLSPTSSYAVQMGVIDADWYLHQANIRWRDVKHLGNVTFGYLVVPQTLENLLPFGGSTFMEPGLPVLAFAPGNRMGVQTDVASKSGRSTLTLGIFSVGQNPGLNFRDETQSLLRPTVRVTTLPYLSGDGTSRRSLLHLGLSAAYLVAEDSGIRYRARPESFLAPFLVDTGDIAARNAAFLGTEIAWMAGPFTLQSEAVLNRVARGTEANYFGGADVAASWMLTGEQPTYNRAVGIPERIIPAKDLSPKNGTWGAWQLGLRLSYLDLNDGEVRGGRMVTGTAGLNWWWNRYLRWQINYIYAATQDGVSPGRLQILQGRLQIMY
jgi:phosphate-selective porin OprO/OprP